MTFSFEKYGTSLDKTIHSKNKIKNTTNEQYKPNYSLLN